MSRKDRTAKDPVQGTVGFPEYWCRIAMGLSLALARRRLAKAGRGWNSRLCCLDVDRGSRLRFLDAI